MTKLTRDLAEQFATLALAHVSREFPNKMDHVLTSDADARTPRALHPIFFGSFDWHSCVHGYWLLARVLRHYPALKAAPPIAELFDARFTEENVASECAYVDRPSARGFERPYGWGWLLALQAEFNLHTDGAVARAGVQLAPLAQHFARRFNDFLPLCDYPVRTGVHSCTAFALRMAADYTETTQPDLYALMRGKVRAWYGSDRNAQAWEPSQDDFLSPTLMEAECTRRFLSPHEFQAWFSAFLPAAKDGLPATLFSPARVSDRSDGKIAHLDGLNFSRAWCWRGVASSCLPLAQIARETADRHIEASLPHVAGDYMGEHWLATFALLALES